MKNKIIFCTMCLVTIVFLLTGCGNEKSSLTGKRLEKYIDQKVEEFENKEGEKHWVEILEPTHGKSENYPFDCFGISSVKLGAGNCWNPNKDLSDIENVDYYGTTTKGKFNSYEDLLNFEFKDSATLLFKNGTTSILEGLTVYTNKYKTSTVKKALEDKSWVINEKITLSMFMLDNNISKKEMFITILKKWGMPSEVYSDSEYDVNWLLYKCNGYEVWIELCEYYELDFNHIFIIGDGYKKLDVKNSMDTTIEKVINEYKKI